MESKTNRFLIKKKNFFFFGWHGSSKPALGTLCPCRRSPRPFLSAGTLGRPGRPRSRPAPVPRPRTSAPEGRAGHGGIPAPAAALPRRVFLGSKGAPQDRRFWRPRPGFRFHLTHPARLISASPLGDSHPPPAARPGPARARELLKSGAFQSQRSRRDLSLSPSGEGTAGQGGEKPWGLGRTLLRPPHHLHSDLMRAPRPAGCRRHPLCELILLLQPCREGPS